VLPTQCTQCGREVQAGSAQCPHCGAPLAAPPPAAPAIPVQPHRGLMILVFGILGLVFSVLPCCCLLNLLVALPLGIVAWVMGNHDLGEIEAGRMDPSGRGLTLAGKICGIVSVAFAALSLVAWIVLLAVGITVPEP